MNTRLLILIVVFIFLITIGAFAILVRPQTGEAPKSSATPTPTIAIKPIKTLKLIRHLVNGKQEITEFDCSGFMTRSEVSKTNKVEKQQKFKVSEETVRAICDSIGAKYESLENSYGNIDAKNGYYTLTITTATGTKTITFSFDGQGVPIELINLVSDLQNTTGTIITPTPNTSIPTPTRTPTPAQSAPTPTPTSSASGQTPTSPPSVCDNAGPLPTGRPTILSNTVCTPPQ